VLKKTDSFNKRPKISIPTDRKPYKSGFQVAEPRPVLRAGGFFAEAGARAGWAKNVTARLPLSHVPTEHRLCQKEGGYYKWVITKSQLSNTVKNTQNARQKFHIKYCQSGSYFFVQRLRTTPGVLPKLRASQHTFNASNGAKITKFLSRVVMPQFWQYARCRQVTPSVNRRRKREKRA